MKYGVIEEALKKLDIREIAYAIYSLIINPNEPQYLIVDKEKVEILNELLNVLIGDFYGDSKTGMETIEKPFVVISRDDFEKNWKNYDGKRIVLVEEDKNLKSNAVEALASIIAKAVKNPFPPPEEKVKTTLYNSLTAIHKIIIEKKNGAKDDKKLLESIKSSIVFDEQLDFIKEILKIRGFPLSA